MTRGGKAPLKDLLSKVIAQFNKMVTLKRHRVDSQRRALIYNLFLAMIFAAFCSRPFVIIFEVPIIICLFKTGLISSIINTIWHILGMMWFVKAEMPRVCASTSPSALRYVSSRTVRYGKPTSVLHCSQNPDPNVIKNMSNGWSNIFGMSFCRTAARDPSNGILCARVDVPAGMWEVQREEAVCYHFGPIWCNCDDVLHPSNPGPGMVWYCDTLWHFLER